MASSELRRSLWLVTQLERAIGRAATTAWQHPDVGDLTRGPLRHLEALAATLDGELAEDIRDMLDEATLLLARGVERARLQVVAECRIARTRLRNALGEAEDSDIAAPASSMGIWEHRHQRRKGQRVRDTHLQDVPEDASVRVDGLSVTTGSGRHNRHGLRTSVVRRRGERLLVVEQGAGAQIGMGADEYVDWLEDTFDAGMPAGARGDVARIVSLSRPPTKDTRLVSGPVSVIGQTIVIWQPAADERGVSGADILHAAGRIHFSRLHRDLAARHPDVPAELQSERTNHLSGDWQAWDAPPASGWDDAAALDDGHLSTAAQRYAAAVRDIAERRGGTVSAVEPADVRAHLGADAWRHARLAVASSRHEDAAVAPGASPVIVRPQYTGPSGVTAHGRTDRAADAAEWFRLAALDEIDQPAAVDELGQPCTVHDLFPNRTAYVARVRESARPQL